MHGEPCNWTVTHYLEELVKKNPAVVKRNATSWMLDDAKIIKDNVIAGTVAETIRYRWPTATR